jgi:hypothetical protein
VKKAFRTGALVLAVLGFVAFFSVNWKTEWHLRRRGVLPDEMEPSRVYHVGLPGSPWLTYSSTLPQPDGSTYSGFDLVISGASWSWLVLAAAIASIWAYRKLAPARAFPSDRSLA